MIKFLQGLATAIANKSRAEDQILFSKDTGKLQIDVKEGNTVNRYDVKDERLSALDGETFLIL